MNNMLTVITPTYNRAYILDKCYQSLLEQTNKNFIWMVVDDGSTDNTEDLVNEWMSHGYFEIKYIKKQNGGKASALNVGFDNLNTPYVCCLDSDDTFYPETVSIVLNYFEKIKYDNSCCGIFALRHNVDGMPIGGKQIPYKLVNITAAQFLELNLNTEGISFYKAEMIHKFPTFNNEKFVSPGWLDYEISRNHYFLVSREKLCCCEYIADGLTKNKRKVIVKNPQGYTCVKRQSFEMSKSFRNIVKQGIMYDCGCIIGKDKNWLKNAPKKFWAVVLKPLAWFVYFKRFRNLQREIEK